MVEQCVGFAVVGEVVTMVHVELPDEAEEPATIIADDTWRLQKGGRPQAYDVMYRRCANYLREHNVAKVVVKASAISKSTKLAHLESAELRGVIIAASASVASVKAIPKGLISRTYGDRKVDEYLEDDDFWARMTIGGSLRKSSREAAMVVIAARND